MFGFSQEIENVAAQILQYVTENGRVQGDGEGGFNPEAIETEVEFEARERGYENSDEIGNAAREMAEFEDHTDQAYKNIESQREETETMNKSHMLYQSGSQSEESGQMLIGFVAVTVGACAVAYGVYKIAEPLTTMLP